MNDIQKLKLKLLEIYQGDLVNAKLAFKFIMEDEPYYKPINLEKNE